MVSNIVFNLDSHILNTGNELRDAPGTADANQAHADAATESLRDADKMVFADSTHRAASTSEIKRLLHWAYRRRGYRKILLVLTKCDIGVERDRSIDFMTPELQKLRDIDNELQRVNMECLRIKSELNSYVRGTLEERRDLEDEGKDFEYAWPIALLMERD